MTNVDSWAIGNFYTGTSSTPHHVAGSIPHINKDASLLDSTSRIVSKGLPQYENHAVSVNGQAIIHGADNQNGFQQTVGGWKSH